jgi:DNA topoisomerase I
MTLRNGTDNELFAEEAGLRYVTDLEPGITRKKRGKGFHYLDPGGNRVTSDRTLHRIGRLVLPPAWNSVWICRHENGHLQATGRDLRQRKQYRYHQHWSELRNENKFEKLALFGNRLSDLRARIASDLKKPDLTREQVLATVVQVMEETMIRIGNEEYAEENDSYGLTTILNDHVEVQGSKVKFRFRGKSGVLHESTFADRKISRIIRKCQELPGQELFAYEADDGSVCDIESGDVNAYLKTLSGEHITAKDFRTWGATVFAAHTLHSLGPPQSPTKTERKNRDLHAVKQASAYLGNTTAVCRKYYIHPKILQADESGELFKAFEKAKKDKLPRLSVAESAVLNLL